MSKKAKQASKQKNLQAKRTRKQSNTARYQALALAGKNSKSVRARAVNKNSKKVKTVDHADGFCGNPACVKCFPNMKRPVVTKYVKPVKV